MAVSTTFFDAATMHARVNHLRQIGIPVEPSDAQQMLLEMIPDARWEIVAIDHWADVVHARHLVGIRTRVTKLEVVDTHDVPDVVIDVLNEETRTEEVPHALDRTSTNPVAGYSVPRSLCTTRPIAG